MALEDYPLENRVPGERSDLSIAIGREPAPVPLARPEARRPVTHPRLDQHEKLMVGPARNALSLEQYRRLAASLHDAQIERGLRAVVVTSTAPKEGKTLTAVNLALTFSESYGRRVLLIDADLRRPAIHQVLGIPNERGLSDVFRSDRLDPALVQVSPMLSVLTAGRSEQNPLAGLSSDRMRALLEDSAGRYDWIIIDTPPLAMLSDAQILTRLTQAAVFVVRAGVTPFAAIDRSIEAVGREFIVGTVLNGAEDNAIVATSYYGKYLQDR
jgi:capsular exopolysaccharide synthesis family protein